MKFPSFEQIARTAAGTLKRFPFVILDAMIGTAVGLILVDHEGPAAPTFLFNVLFAAILGIPLFLMLTVVSEFRRWSSAVSVPAHLVGVTALIVYAFSLPVLGQDVPAVHVFRAMFLGAALVCGVVLATAGRGGGPYALWSFNKHMWLRLLMAGLYTHVLYAGLALALAAIDHLFGFSVPGKRYFELWVTLNGLFTTWFFLAGIPAPGDGHENEADLTGALRIFTTYVLGPLLIVYLVILYAYLVKIVAAWTWPDGWVSGLILGCSTAGILAFLLLTPIRGRTDQPLCRMMQTWFWPAVGPMSVMLMLAVWRRVSEYGVTEGRYVALVIGGWLFLMSVFYMVSKSKPISAIAVSLGLIALVTWFGPWSAFSVSERSQVARLKEILERNNILVNGTIHKIDTTVSIRDSRDINSIVTYLRTVHGYSSIQPWFKERLSGDTAEASYKDAATVVGMMGIAYERVWQSGGGGMAYLSSDRSHSLDVTGYQRLIRSIHVSEESLTGIVAAESLSYHADTRLEHLTLVFRGPGGADSVTASLKELTGSLSRDYGVMNSYNVPQTKMLVRASGRTVDAELVLLSLNLRKRDDSVQIVSFETQVLYGRRPE